MQTPWGRVLPQLVAAVPVLAPILPPPPLQPGLLAIIPRMERCQVHLRSVVSTPVVSCWGRGGSADCMQPELMRSMAPGLHFPVRPPQRSSRLRRLLLKDRSKPMPAHVKKGVSDALQAWLDTIEPRELAKLVRTIETQPGATPTHRFWQRRLLHKTCIHCEIPWIDKNNACTDTSLIAPAIERRAQRMLPLRGSRELDNESTCPRSAEKQRYVIADIAGDALLAVQAQHGQDFKPSARDGKRSVRDRRQLSRLMDEVRRLLRPRNDPLTLLSATAR